MTWLEFFALGYLLWGAMRGSMRGLAREVDSLIGVALALAFLLGFNFHAEFREALLQLFGLKAQSLGLIGTLVLYISGWLLMRSFRGRLQDWINLNWSPAKNRIWGSVCGAVRNTLVIALLMVLSKHDPLSYVRSLFL